MPSSAVIDNSEKLHLQEDFADSQATIRGDLSGMQLPEILTILEVGGKTGLLKIEFSETLPKTYLAIKNGKIGRIRSAFLPSWYKSLLHIGVPEVELSAQKYDGFNVVQKIEELKTVGLINQEQVQELLKHRMLMALLPIFHCNKGSFSFSPENVDSGYIEPGMHATALSLELSRRLDELKNINGIEFNPNQSFKLSNLIGDFSDRIADLDKNDWMLISIFSQKTSLAEASKKSHLLWNEIVLSVQKLEKLGLIGLENPSNPKKNWRLEAAFSAPPFSLTSLSSETVSLGSYRGKKILLSLNRGADCPICNTHIQSLIEAYPRLKKQGIEVIAIFHADLSDLQNRVGRLLPPFPLLADPDGVVHESYKLSKSFFGLISPKNMPEMRRGMKLEGTGIKVNKEFLTMPAEFLINPDLSIYKAHYYAYIADSLPIDTVFEWASQDD